MNGWDEFSRVVDDEPKAAPEPTGDGLLASVGKNTWAARGEELVQRALARLDGTEAPVPTPWAGINRRLGGGLWPGMHVVVGGTGTGKSQWALQVCMHAAQAGTPVLVLSLELDALGVFARAAVFVGADLGLPRVQWSSIYTGCQGEKDEDTRKRVRAVLDAATPVLAKLPFHWVEAPPHGLPHTKIIELTRELRAQYPTRSLAEPVILVVDFLQLIAGIDPREDTITRVSQAAYACRAVARDLNAVVLVLSSASRAAVALMAVAERKESVVTRVAAHELVGVSKESGDVEFSADSVMSLCRESYTEGTPPLEGGRAVHLAVAKVRAGQSGWHEMRFDGSRFIEAPAQSRWMCAGCGDAVDVTERDGIWTCGKGHEVEPPVEGGMPVDRPLSGQARKEAERARKEAEKAQKAKAAEEKKRDKATQDATAQEAKATALREKAAQDATVKEAKAVALREKAEAEAKAARVIADARR